MKRINYRTFVWFVFLLPFAVVLPLAVIDFYAALFLPSPDFKVSVGLLEGEEAVREFAPESSVSIMLSGEPLGSIVPRGTIRTAVSVDNVRVATHRWPFLNWNNREYGPLIAEFHYVCLLDRFLVDGEHTLTVRSYQRRGMFLFIFGTVREKTAEYKMIVSDNVITSLDRLDPLED